MVTNEKEMVARSSFTAQAAGDPTSAGLGDGDRNALAPSSEGVASWRSGSTCSVGGYRTGQADQGRHKRPRQDLARRDLGGREIASPWHSCEDCRWHSLTDRCEFELAVRVPVVGHSCWGATSMRHAAVGVVQQTWHRVAMSRMEKIGGLVGVRFEDGQGLACHSPCLIQCDASGVRRQAESLERARDVVHEGKVFPWENLILSTHHPLSEHRPSCAG
jgi:hypothetical protein